ncbi:MAG: ABC transporter substrate-binding protein [Flavonifractor plautii]
MTFDEQNAGGEHAPPAPPSSTALCSESVDLIMANATPLLQAAQSATADIPILGTSVTDYGIALASTGLVPAPLGSNISGTSDLAPLDQQAAMLRSCFPDAENVGLLYCSAEPNCRLPGGDIVQGYLEEHGLHLHPVRLLRRQRPGLRDPDRLRQPATSSISPPTTPPPPTPAPSHNVVVPAGVPVICRRDGHLLRLRRGHPVHRATTSWARSPARWPSKILTGEEGADPAIMASPFRHHPHQDVQRRHL